MGRSVSFFIVGLLSGAVVTSAVFTFYVRDLRRAAGGASGGAQRYVLKLAHGLDEKHPVHAAMVHMQQRLTELSGGQVELQIFPGGQLGNETHCLELLQQGELAMTKTSAAPMESFVPEMAVFGLPYVFRDRAHYWQVLDGPIGQELLLKGESDGLRGLCYYDAGARSFYTVDKPVREPSDLQGLKIRVQKSQTAMQLVRAFDAAPAAIAWGELYSSLQQGTVDGAENNLPSYRSSGHWEVAKYFCVNEHTRVPDVLLMSAAIWDDLPPRVRRWVSQAAAESSQVQRELWTKRSQEVRRELENMPEGKRVTFIEPDQQAFAAQVVGMRERFASGDVLVLLQRIRETK